MQFCSFVLNWSIAKNACLLKICDISNDVKLFLTVCHKFLMLSNQTSRFKIKCIRIGFTMKGNTMNSDQTAPILFAILAT